MKKPLHLLLAALSILMFRHPSNAQVTLVSNNTNLTTGFVLPNNKPLLLDDDGGLWTTDGTVATKITTAVTHPDTLSAAVFNNQIYFAGVDATTNDIELWVTDGTSSGTKLIANISPGGSSSPNNFFVLNNTLYFTADDGTHGRELWKTNGAVGNASLVADINSGSADGIESDASLFQNGSTVFFVAVSASDTSLWKIDNSGTPAAIKKISGTIELTNGLYAAALGNKTVFTVQTGSIFTGDDKTQLWITDGTSNNTSLIKDFGVGTGFMFPQFVLFNGVLFFDGATPTNIPFQPDTELWTTDGTTANTKLFKDIQPGAVASTPDLIGAAIMNNKLYFTATTNANGTELWYTDGTVANTIIFKDINSGANSSEPSFFANIGTYANLNNLTNFNYQQLFSTAFNGRLYFTADDGTHGIEVWSTDGTPNGTSILKDINTNKADGVNAGAGDGAFYSTAGIYFVANDGSKGFEPWFTDGTANGTVNVADVNTGAKKSSDPVYLFLYNSQLYFNADNGDGGNTPNTDLYKINQLLTVLPANLLTFNVALRNGAVALNWTTTSEINTSNFVIERSTDAVHFSALGTVAAAGNSNAAHQYQFTDAGALQAGASILYYRLRVVDKDGRYVYTTILPVRLQGGVFTIKLSPNPVHDRLTVAFSTNNTKRIVLSITDANGKTVYRQQMQADGIAAMQQNIDVARFAAGTYFVQLATDKETKTAQFIKQ